MCSLNERGNGIMWEMRVKMNVMNHWSITKPSTKQNMDDSYSLRLFHTISLSNVNKNVWAKSVVKNERVTACTHSTVCSYKI